MVSYVKSYDDIKVKEILNSADKFYDWHFSFNQKCDIVRLRKLVNNCQATLRFSKDNFNELVEALAEDSIKRYELDLFIRKLDYYLNRIRRLKIELRNHVVNIDIKYKNIKVLRKDFKNILSYTNKKGNVTKFYILTHYKYKYIFNGITSDLRPIKDFKQAKYASLYIEILCMIDELNKVWKLNAEKLQLESITFNFDNVSEKLQFQCVQLHKIYNIHTVYNKSITKVLKKNTCFKALNPYLEDTYERIEEVLDYLCFYNIYLEKKTSEGNENMLKNILHSDIIYSITY